MKTITKPDIIVFPKYIRSIQAGTATTQPKFAAGGNAAAFSVKIFEKYVGIVSDDMVYPALIFLNNLTGNVDGGALRGRSVLLAVRLFLMRSKIREEKNFFGVLTINAEKEVSKSYETVLSQIKLSSPDVYYFLSKIGNNVVSELGNNENNINIILNELEKKSVYSNATAQNILSVFRTVVVREYKFSYDAHSSEEIREYNTASSERDTHTYDLNSNRVLREKNSDVSTKISDSETNKYDNGHEKTYFTENTKPDLSQAKHQFNIDNFINEKHINRVSAETAEGDTEKTEYVTAESVLRSETKSSTAEKISEKHSETVWTAVSNKSISDNLSSLRHFAKKFLCLSGLKNIGIISNEREILFKSNKRENNFLTALFTSRSVDDERSDDHFLERVITEHSNTYRILNRIFNSSTVFSERLVERIKSLSGIEKSAQFVREKSSIFARDELLKKQIERFNEHSDSFENNYFENTVSQRIGTERVFNNSAVFSDRIFEGLRSPGDTKKSVRLMREIREKSRFFSHKELLNQQIERFNERDSFENNYLENTITQRLGTERNFNNLFTVSERIFERVKMLGGAEKSAKFVREKNNYFSRKVRFESQFTENRTEKQSQSTERSYTNNVERIFNETAAISRRFTEYIKTVESIEKLTQFVSEKNNVFFREEQLEAQSDNFQINTLDRLTERLLTERGDVERIFNKSNTLSERFVKRVKALSSIEKFTRAIQNFREKKGAFSQKNRLEKLPERAGFNSRVFLTADNAPTHYRRISEYIITTFKSGISKFTKSFNYSITDHKIRMSVRRDIAGKYPNDAENSAQDTEKNTVRYNRTVNLNYKIERSERSQTDLEQSGVLKDELIERYGNLIDYDVSQPPKSAAAFTLTDAALIRSNSEMAAINKANIEQLKEKQIELERNVLSRSDADRLYDDFMRRLRQQMRLEKSRFTG